MISVLILSLNEEQNLARCLEAIRWSDDVLVLDSFSTDRTIEVARAGGARVLQNRFVNFAEQRNFGLEHGGMKHDWILHLDADEVVTAELRRELTEVVQSGEHEAYRLASRMIFQGRWLKHAGLYPWYQVRLGRRSKLTFVQVGHGQRESLAPELVGTLREPLLHYGFSKGISDWVERHNRYSSSESAHYCAMNGEESLDWAGLLAPAADRRRRALKKLFSQLPFRPSLRFLYMYFFKLGLLDGRAGLTYCRLLRIYEYLTVLKIRELKDQGLQRNRVDGLQDRETNGPPRV